MKKTRHSKPVLTQTQNNTTFWIGHLNPDPVEHFAGQTFTCPTEGDLDNIQVLSSAVANPGKLVLTLHHFDPDKRTWGPELSTSTVTVERNNKSAWIQFELPSIKLERGRHYGFKLVAPDAFVAIGEAVTGNKEPFENGQEWTGSSRDKEGHYFTYFSLAYKVELKAS